MRITNKIMQNNSLTNINSNKVLQDSLSTQTATQKKISRPSEDPIIALRSLRLRTSVNQTTQYLEKNVEDANSWLTVTEDAITTLSEIITDIRKQYVKGASDSLTVSDRDIIRENLEALAAEVFNTGNVDFAGRSVFTGYRTDSSLTFKESTTLEYSVCENINAESADKVSFVHTGDLKADGTVEQDVYSGDVDRIRLAYENCEDKDITLSYSDGITTTNLSPVKMSSTAVPSPYEYVYNNPDETVFVPETGEVLIGADVAQDALKDGSSFFVNYFKVEWSKGDLKPEHYFECEDANGIQYNVSGANGEIEYNIGVNQSIRVNTLASECFNHSIGRDIDDLINAIDEVEHIEATISDLKAELNAIDETDTAARRVVSDKIDAARKTQTYLNGKLHKLFSDGIAKADSYLNQNNLALTDCGTRSKRLDLIKNRLDTQLSTLNELKSENEDSDLAETAIKLKSAQYAYDASLMSTAKIMQETLLDYI